MVRITSEVDEEDQGAEQEGCELSGQADPGDQTESTSNMTQDVRMEASAQRAKEESEDTFKKPVFISRIQRQTNRSGESKNTEEEKPIEGEGAKDEDALSTGAELMSKSPAQQLVEKSVPLPYKEPAWSGLPSAEYSFEVLKNGIIVEVIPLTQPFIVLGRLQQCDVVMQHPSLSRYHCIVQYRAEETTEHPCGFYGYDLGSTHGTYHNKHRMKPLTYYHLRVGHLLKLGGSTRMLILQGPEEDQEEEVEESATELMTAATKSKKKLERLETGELEDGEEENKQKKQQDSKTVGGETQSGGIDWGMGDDAQEEADDGEGVAEGVNPFASLNEEVYVADPKKTLRGWLEREGYDLPEYRMDDLGRGTFSCSVDLPVPGPGGGPLVARVDHKGRKKDAVVLCAREACRLLDKMGVLRQATHEGLERRRRNWAENDYYDSDEDDFLDRTGDIQRKRIKRMEQAGSGSELVAAQTYNTLLKKYNVVTKELADLEERLAAAETLKRTGVGAGEAEEDDLDSFMLRLKSDVPDKHKRVTWKLRAIELRKDELRLRRLTNVARPPGAPEILPYSPKCESGSARQAQCSNSSTKLLNTLGRPYAQSKASTKPVHKIFMEEEPEQKLKLRRLDDDDDRDLPKPQPYKKDTQRKDTKKPTPSSLTSTSSKYNSSESSMNLESQIFVEEKVISLHKGDTCSSKDQSHFVNKPPTEETNSTASQISSKMSKGVSVGSERDFVMSEEVSLSSGSSDTVVEMLPSEKTPARSDTVIEMPPPEKRPARDEEMGESISEKKGRILGPTLPPHLAHLRTGQQDYNKAKKKTEKRGKKYDEDDPNYSSWVPPKNQTGDGRTSLNQKLGY